MANHQHNDDCRASDAATVAILNALRGANRDTEFLGKLTPAQMQQVANAESRHNLRK